jgi:hypothetical protein
MTCLKGLGWGNLDKKEIRCEANRMEMRGTFSHSEVEFIELVERTTHVRNI